MPQLLLPSINWECDAVPKPARGVYIDVPSESLESLVMLQSCHSSIALEDESSKGSYSVLKAPLPLSDPYRPGDGYDIHEYSPVFIVYADSIWYVLEPKGVTIIPKLLKQEITEKVKKAVCPES